MPYKDPEKHKEYCRQYRKTHREQLNEWDRQYRQSPGGQEKQREYYKRLKADPEKWQRKLERDRTANRKKREALRDTIIELLGGRCSICGFSDRRALQVDHLNGGGNQERTKAKSMTAYYKRIIESGGSEFQLLCANCNQIKRYERGEGYVIDR